MFGFIGMPGLMEMIIIGLIVALPVAIVFIVLGVTRANRQGPGPPNPNLTPCPDCGRYISVQAPTCPGCGRPMR